MSSTGNSRGCAAQTILTRLSAVHCCSSTHLPVALLLIAVHTEHAMCSHAAYCNEHPCNSSSGTAAFLPFLKKAAPPVRRDEDEDDHDPLALPLPPPKRSRLGAAMGQFVARVNAASHTAPPDADGRQRVVDDTDDDGMKGGSGKGVAASRRPHAPKLAQRGQQQQQSKVAALQTAAAAAGVQAEAERRRVRQLQRLAKLGALVQDNAPEAARAKIQQACQQAAKIQQQQQQQRQQEAAKRGAGLAAIKQQPQRQQQQQQQHRAAQSQQQQQQQHRAAQSQQQQRPPPLSGLSEKVRQPV
jgi:hypothetical protein